MKQYIKPEASAIEVNMEDSILLGSKPNDEVSNQPEYTQKGPWSSESWTDFDDEE